MSYIKTIRKEMSDMWKLVHSQLTKSLFALSLFDKDYAREVILIEERVNSTKVLIDSHCENILALKSEGQLNIPFLIVIMKMNMQLEKIGDLANNIANQVLLTSEGFSARLMDDTRVIELYVQAENLLANGFEAFEKTSPLLAEEVLELSGGFEVFKVEVNKLTTAYSYKFPHDRQNALTIYSIIKDIERVVDHSKALAKEMIHYTANMRMTA